MSGTPGGGAPTGLSLLSSLFGSQSLPGVAEINTNLINITKLLGQLYTVLGNSYISLAGTNVFTGQDTFKLPPVINAGADGTGTLLPMGNISTQLSAAGIGNGADSTEDTLFTFSLPANSFDAVGRGLAFLAFGKLAANGDTKTTRARFGSTIAYSSGGLTLSGGSWFLSGSIWKTGSNTQMSAFQGQFGATIIAPQTEAGSETDSSPITIKVTGQSGSSTASDVVANGMVLNFMN
jgi:hypothetical protein